MNWILLLPILIPMVMSVFATQKNLIREESLMRFSIFATSLTAASVFYIIARFDGVKLSILHVNEFIDLTLKGGHIGFVFAALASTLWILASAYAGVYMEHEGRVRYFYIFFLITEGITMGIALSGNLFTLYAFYEILTLTTFPLVIHAGTQEALRSGKKYIIYSLFGATLILFGMMILFSAVQTLEFTPGGIAALMAYERQGLLTGAFVALFVGFGVKAALVPLHSWLPAAMVAPTPVSALLHAVAVVKSGIFSLIRMVFFIFGPKLVASMELDALLLSMVLLTVVFGSFMALHQSHLKKRLAYSTISQLGYMLLGIVLLNEDALLGAMIHLINHAIIKIVLFFCVGSITFMTGKKYIHEIGGIGRKMPKTMMCFAIASISLIGIPPSNGFVSKWFLGLGAMGAGQVMNILVLLLSAFLTAGYLLPIVVGAFFTRTADDIADAENLDPPNGMMIPIIIITGFIILMGIFPNPVIGYIRYALKEIFI